MAPWAATRIEASDAVATLPSSIKSLINVSMRLIQSLRNQNHSFSLLANARPQFVGGDGRTPEWIEPLIELANQILELGRKGPSSFPIIPHAMSEIANETGKVLLGDSVPLFSPSIGSRRSARARAAKEAPKSRSGRRLGWRVPLRASLEARNGDRCAWDRFGAATGSTSTPGWPWEWRPIVSSNCRTVSLVRLV